MVELEVENTYYEPVTQTETIHMCDACGEPCDENGGRYPATVRGGWDGRYDLCRNCVQTLDETNQSLQMVSHSSGTGIGSRTSQPRRPIVEWGKRALVWTRGSVWRFIGVYFLLWYLAGVVAIVAEPLGGLFALALMGWLGYEVYRIFTEKDHPELATAKEEGSRMASQALDELDKQVAELASGDSGSSTSGHPGGHGDTTRDVPFDWKGDADVDVDVVLDHIDVDLDRETREHITASVERHRERGDAVDAADIRWIANAAQKLDLEDDNP